MKTLTVLLTLTPFLLISSAHAVDNHNVPQSQIDARRDVSNPTDRSGRAMNQKKRSKKPRFDKGASNPRVGDTGLVSSGDAANLSPAQEKAPNKKR